MDELRNDFALADTTYFLSHSVGRPLKSAELAFKESFLSPWQHSGLEPWGEWLTIIEKFQSSLGLLFNAHSAEFCPQTNLSSALTKIVMSLEALQKKKVVVLMSEIDFPSMGYALKKSLPSCAELRFIDKDLDITDQAVWERHLTNEIDLVFVSNAYSNTGQLAPVETIINRARGLGVISILDVAQSAGIIPLDLKVVEPDFMIGSSVKWLCGGPGAAYLWVNSNIIEQCQPRDVGWFSHENPFEFDVHSFRYHPSAIKFWGGTPSVAPYAFASHSINYFAQIGSQMLRTHNQEMIDKLINSLAPFVASPFAPLKRSGTVIMHFGKDQEKIKAALTRAKISVDERINGMRVSAHIYNDSDEIDKLIEEVQNIIK
ncbi:aminotransferase class V-fold PLP-dependent enzyme [Glaciecola sp. KUL10]|uniref:aminotransferase class V-fold PLP-dependent enzyme n=1 Tax=Glaciecola sp. (strain KUL10) TaxID=2161813 RepID=UPI000D7855D1|nr:aminotransferase class V-fold PLP-dependent enzyme [Glaciecola sp. KUL10]GBL04474.1 class V aminotransferase [Glaciecola sp. KUL10]